MASIAKTLVGENQIPILDKARYAIGTMPIELMYAVFYTYFMIFLTDVAGMSSVTAGIIAGVAAFVDGAVDPFLGVWSDYKYKKDGTRKTAMRIGVYPLATVSILLFIPLGLTGISQIIYYAIVSMIFVTTYSIYAINYSSIPGEITTDYSERNTLRLILSLLTPVCSWIATGGLQIIKTIIPDASVELQWIIFGIVLSAMAVISVLIFFRMVPSRKQVAEGKLKGVFAHQADIGKANVHAEGDGEDEDIKVDIGRNLKEVLSLKALRCQIIMVLSFSLGNGFRYSLIAYALSYTAVLSAAQQAAFWSITNITNYIVLFVSIALVNIFGNRRVVFVFAFGIAALNSFFHFFYGLDTFFSILIFGIIFIFIETPFWAMWMNISFEIADLDEFVYGKRRTALISSISMFMVKIGPTIALITTGAILAACGYVEGGVEQTAATGIAIGKWLTMLNGIFFGIGALSFIGYKINRKNNLALNTALESRKAGKAYSIDGFREILPDWFVKKFEEEHLTGEFTGDKPEQ